MLSEKWTTLLFSGFFHSSVGVEQLACNPEGLTTSRV